MCGWMRVSRIQCVGLIHCLGAGACVAERIHSPFLSLFPSVAEHMDSMKLLRVLLSLSSSQSLCLCLCLTMSVSEFQQRKDFFLFFFTEDLNRLVCERLSVHPCANTFFCFGLVWVFWGCCFVVVIYFSTVAFIFLLWFNLCLFASAQKSFELISSTPLLRIIICNNKPSKCLCLSVCLSLSVSL